MQLNTKLIEKPAYHVICEESYSFYWFLFVAECVWVLEVGSKRSVYTFLNHLKSLQYHLPNFAFWESVCPSKGFI